MLSSDAAGTNGASFAKRPFVKGHVTKSHVAKDRLAKRKAAIARRRGTVALGAKASALPPLHWWRHLPADAFTADLLGVLRRAVAGIGMVGEPRWADAAAVTAGDPDAIAVLVTMIERMGADAGKEALKRSWRNRRRKPARARVAVIPARTGIGSGG
jgi:hypothetical protein